MCSVQCSARANFCEHCSTNLLSLINEAANERTILLPSNWCAFSEVSVRGGNENKPFAYFATLLAGQILNLGPLGDPRRWPPPEGDGERNVRGTSWRRWTRRDHPLVAEPYP